MREFLKDWFENEIEKASEDLLNKYPEKYDTHYDRDYIDGMCVRCDEVHDEDLLYADAKEQVLESISEMEDSWESLVYNAKFINKLIETLK